jgi:catechol 2,3-dioxygenase-like lactoylglutathione lyase family enzyme
MATTAKSRVATAPLHAVLPATDLARAERFYTETLGLEIEKDPDAGGFMVHAGDGCSMFVYETSATAGTATQAMFQVTELDAVVSDLREHGVTFEEYDVPGLKTEGGIAETGGMKTAWFKDSEGNTIAVSERS